MLQVRRYMHILESRAAIENEGLVVTAACIDFLTNVMMGKNEHNNIYGNSIPLTDIQNRSLKHDNEHLVGTYADKIESLHRRDELLMRKQGEFE